jgi:hypothetical protein
MRHVVATAGVCPTDIERKPGKTVPDDIVRGKTRMNSREELKTMLKNELDRKIEAFTRNARPVLDAGAADADAAHHVLGSWEPAGTLPQADAYIAVELKNHDVLAIAQAAYRYDGHTWTAAGALTLAGISATNSSLILLADGKALTTGVDQTTGNFRGAVYHPSTNTWELTGDLNAARRGYAAALLHGGQVLVAGGLNTPPILASAELYDPVSKQWSNTASMNTARSGATAAAIHHGKAVLVMGGLTESASGDFEVVNSVERYDATTPAPQWTTVKPMHNPRQAASSIELPNGKVVVAGGDPSGNTLEVYDPEHDHWDHPVTMRFSRPFTPAMSVLKDGRVLIAGGGDTDVSEIYDPAKHKTMPAAPMSGKRYFPGYCATKHSNVSVVGGLNPDAGFQPWNTAERFHLK